MRRSAYVAVLASMAAASVADAQGSRKAAILSAGALEEARGTRWELPRPLREISGLAVTADGRLLAHGDERARVFELDPVGRRVVKSFTLGTGSGERGDFEGIAVGEGKIFLVTSDGDIYAASEGEDGTTVLFQRTVTGLGARCEIEGLAYQPTGRLLLLACKQARGQEPRAGVAVLRWSLATRAVVEPPFRAALPGGAMPAFAAAGIDRDPASGHFVAVDSRNRVVVELDGEGRLLAALPLSRLRHPQPEGIAVMPTALVVADEGGKKGTGALTIYSRSSAIPARRP